MFHNVLLFKFLVVILLCEILDDAAFEVVGDMARLSSPSLAELGAVRSVPPVPPPRRKSHMYCVQECISNSANCVSSVAKSELFENVDVKDSRRAKSSEDVQTLCTKADRCVCENSNVHDTVFGPSVVDDGSSAADCTLAADTCSDVSPDRGTVGQTDFILPVKPLRRKQRAKTELQDTSDISEVSSTTAIFTLKIAPADRCESSSTQEYKGTFPQPKPRTSLLRNSTTLCSDESDQVAGKPSELAIENDAVTMDSVCQTAKSDSDSLRTVPMNGAKDKENKAGQLLDCQKPNGSNEQNQLEVKSDVSVAAQRSSFLVPSRAAPPPPLSASGISTASMLPSRVAPPPPMPKPKIIIHSSGSSEVVNCSDNCDISQNKTSSDSDNMSDNIPTSSLSSKTATERSQQQLGHNEVFLPDSEPPGDTKSNSTSVFCPSSTSSVHSSVVSSTATVAVGGRKMKGPAVPKKKPKPACRRSLDVSSGMKSVNAADTRRLSESVVHDGCSSSLHSVSSDAADQLSPKPYPRQDVVLGFAGLSLPENHDTAADAQNSLSPRESCSSFADTGSVSACSPLEPPISSPSLMSPGPEMYDLDTPPITPAAFTFDANDEDAQTVCCCL